MNFVLPILAALCVAASAQIVLHQQQALPLPYALQAGGGQPRAINYAHRSVIENSLRESQLPAELLNNPYKNPKIAEALAKQSWFTDKEMPVIEREADKIPREQVFKIFKNAGWIQRRR